MSSCPRCDGEGVLRLVVTKGVTMGKTDMFLVSSDLPRETILCPDCLGVDGRARPLQPGRRQASSLLSASTAAIQD